MGKGKFPSPRRGRKRSLAHRQDRREGLLIPMFGISERAEGVENSLMALADYWEEG